MQNAGPFLCNVAREGSCFPGSRARRAFCAGKYPQAPCKHCPSEGGTTAPGSWQMEVSPAPSRGPRRAGSPAAGTHSPWARVGKVHPWALGSSTQPSPRGVREAAAVARPGKRRGQPVLGAQGRCCRSPLWRRARTQQGVRPKQPTPERVSLVNINFISFKAKLTKPLQCKNVLSVIPQRVVHMLCLLAGVSYMYLYMLIQIGVCRSTRLRQGLLPHTPRTASADPPKPL